MIVYFAAYEQCYQFPIERPVRVVAVHRAGQRLQVETDRGNNLARAVISATGTWGKPLIPDYLGREQFRGVQLHARQAGRLIAEEPGGLSDIVMPPPVREARARGVLKSVRPSSASLRWVWSGPRATRCGWTR